MTNCAYSGSPTLIAIKQKRLRDRRTKRSNLPQQQRKLRNASRDSEIGLSRRKLIQRGAIGSRRRSRRRNEKSRRIVKRNGSDNIRFKRQTPLVVLLRELGIRTARTTVKMTGVSLPEKSVWQRKLRKEKSRSGISTTSLQTSDLVDECLSIRCRLLHSTFPFPWILLHYNCILGKWSCTLVIRFVQRLRNSIRLGAKSSVWESYGLRVRDRGILQLILLGHTTHISLPPAHAHTHELHKHFRLILSRIYT